MMIYLPFLVLFFGLCGIPAAESMDTCHSCYQGKLFKDVVTFAQEMQEMQKMSIPDIIQAELEKQIARDQQEIDNFGNDWRRRRRRGMNEGRVKRNAGLIDLATLKMPAESSKCLNPDNTVPTEECNGGKCMALLLNIPGIGNNVARACIPELNNLFFGGSPEKLGAPVDKIVQHVYEFILHDLHAGMTVTLPSSISADVKALAKSFADIELDEMISERKEMIPQLNYINQISGGKLDADLFIKDASAAPINVINTVANSNSKTCQAAAAASPTTCFSCFSGTIFKELFSNLRGPGGEDPEYIPEYINVAPQFRRDLAANLGVPVDVNFTFPTESEKCLKPDSTVTTQERNGGKCVGFILTVPGVGVNVVRTAFPKINSEQGRILARYINDFHGSVEINLPESFSKFKEILKADFNVDIDEMKAEGMPAHDAKFLDDTLNKLSPGKLSIDTFANNNKCNGSSRNQVIGILYMIMLPLLIVLL